VTERLVPRDTLPGTAAVAAIGLVTAAFAVVLGRIPWPRIDLANAMQRADDLGWTETWRAAFASGVEYRPVMIVATKAAYTVGGLHLWFYQALVLLEFAAVLWVLLVLWRPRSWQQRLAAFVALACVVGLHTSRVLFLFRPLNGGTASIILMLLATLIVVEPAGRRLQWLLLPLTFGALLLLEYGILIVPIVIVAWWMSAPGVSRAGVAAAVAGVLLYAVTRRVLGASVGELVSPESGLGFDDVSPQQIKGIFAHAPWLFWLYNVASSLLTVLVSEPRSGKFKFVNAALHGVVAPWQWLHLLSSMATSAVVIGALVVRRSWPSRERLLAAAGVVMLLGGSALGFLYTRDRIALPAGFGYAILVYVALSAMLEQMPMVAWRGRLSLAVVIVVGLCWVWRCGEAGFPLRDRAWSYYLEWTVRYHPEQPETGLVRDLRLQVLAHRPPDPRRDPLWTHRWFEREFDPLAN
jgi:hypothetical protein